MTDFIIVGGGIIGMLTARELARAGADVTLVEKGESGRESSWAGGGILSPLYPWRYPAPVSELARWSQARYHDLAAELTAETGIDPEWTRSGLLILDADDQAAAEAWAERYGARLFTPETTELADIEPALAGDTASAPVWLPDVAQVRNPRLAKALKQSLSRAGVVLRERTPVTGLCLEGDRIKGVETPESRLTAAAVVIAGGAWSGELLAALGTQLAVKPVRGQMILFKTPPGLVNRIVLSRDRYVIPRQDGHVVVGSTVEEVGFDKQTTAQALQELTATAHALVPALREFSVQRHWAGLRPGSPQGVPFIGAHPQIQGLYVNAGHYRNGVVMAPASARLLADLLLQRPPIVKPHSFRVT